MGSFMQLQSLDDAHSPLIQTHGADTAPLCHHLYINISRHLGNLEDTSTLGVDSVKINQGISDWMLIVAVLSELIFESI